jgi:hypothetical protein
MDGRRGRQPPSHQSTLLSRATSRSRSRTGRHHISLVCRISTGCFVSPFPRRSSSWHENPHAGDATSDLAQYLGKSLSVCLSVCLCLSYFRSLFWCSCLGMFLLAWQILAGPDGAPLMLPDGNPLMVMQGIMPQPVMGPDGRPAMGPDGKMLGALPVGPGQV